MNIINYYNYELSFCDLLELQIEITTEYGSDVIKYRYYKNIDVFFFAGNPTLISKIGIRHLLPKL